MLKWRIWLAPWVDVVGDCGFDRVLLKGFFLLSFFSVCISSVNIQIGYLVSQKNRSFFSLNSANLSLWLPARTLHQLLRDAGIIVRLPGFRTGLLALAGWSVYHLAAYSYKCTDWIKFETGRSANGVRKVQILQ